MHDGCGRSVSYLRLSVTDRCNCRCTYCMPPQGVTPLAHEQMCSLEELARITSVLVEMGVTKVRLTGGEPLARRGVVELVRMIRALPSVEEIAMTTNATMLAPVAEELVFAGLDRINVSLNSLDPARYAEITRGGRLEDALAGLDAARAAGLTPLKINCVLMGGVNLDEIPQLAELSRHEALDVRFIELMPIGEGALMPPERFVSADVVHELLPGLVQLPTEGVAERYTMPGWKGSIGLIRPMSCKFCAGCSRIRVTADGHLKTCLHGREELALAGLSHNALRETITQALGHKPEHHQMDRGHASDSARPMSKIGG